MRRLRVQWGKPEVEAGRWREAGGLKVPDGGESSRTWGASERGGVGDDSQVSGEKDCVDGGPFYRDGVCRGVGSSI